MEPLRFPQVATITLKNIPADLHRQLKKRAEEHHRILNKEIIATKCSADDCEFVALAYANGVRLLTIDRQILHEFPEVAISLKRFVRDRGSVANP